MRDHFCVRAVRWGGPLLWMALIFFLSSQSTLPNLTPGLPDLQAIAGHLATFGVLGWLWWWALRSAGVPHPALWSLAIAIAYGLSDEYHQSFVPGRTADPFDLAMDTLGAAIVLLSASLWRALVVGRRRQAFGLRRRT